MKLANSILNRLNQDESAAGRSLAKEVVNFFEKILMDDDVAKKLNDLIPNNIGLQDEKAVLKLMQGTSMAVAKAKKDFFKTLSTEISKL